MAEPVTVEQIIRSPHAFGLPATPLQVAICRMVDGRSLGSLATHEHVVWAMGGADAVAQYETSVVGHLPLEFYLLAAIRTFKSMLAAAVAIRSVLTVDLSMLGPGEVARLSILSTTKFTAKQIWKHIHGNCFSKPALHALVLDCIPSAWTITLESPSGRPVDIRISAGENAGASLISDWSAGAYLDEFPRMTGSSDKAVSFESSRDAVIGRLLPGAQLLGIGSPYAALGPAFDKFTEHWANPSKDAVFIYRAKGPWLNPVWWTKARCEELARRNPAAYRTDVDGEFAEEYAGLFASGQLQNCVRIGDVQVPYEPGQNYVAAMDPATRHDTWTLVVLTRLRGGKLQVVHHRQWRGTAHQPLKPADVFGEMAQALSPYGVTSVQTDQWRATTLRQGAYEHGLILHEHQNTEGTQLESFNSLRLIVGDGMLEIPDDKEFIDDLRRVRRVTTARRVYIDLPRQGGRHCDYAAALALATRVPLSQPRDRKREFDVSAFSDVDEQRLLDAAAAKAQRTGQVNRIRARLSRR